MAGQRTWKLFRDSLFNSPLFPLSFEHRLCELPPNWTIAGWRIRHRLQPHPGGSVGYRLDGPSWSLAYITDTTTDPNDAEAIAFAHQVDVLVHECYFPDEYSELAQRSGHSTVTVTAEFALAVPPPSD